MLGVLKKWKLLMKLGDLVKWIGFPGATIPIEEKYGIVIKKIHTHPASSDRLNVLWGDGTIGRNIYQETIEVISESR